MVSEWILYIWSGVVSFLGVFSFLSDCFFGRCVGLIGNCLVIVLG